jgi:hypothetical protein
MSDIVKGIGNLIASIFQVIEGAVSAVVNTVVTAFQAVFNVIVGAFKSVFSLAEGVVGLIVGKSISMFGTASHKHACCRGRFDTWSDYANEFTGNFLILITLGVAYFAYIEYQKRQGVRNPQPIKNAANTVSKKLE